MIEDEIRRIVKEELAAAVAEIKKVVENSNRLAEKEYGEALTIEEVSKILKISKTKVYDLARNPEFPSRKIGSRVIIPTRKFFDWMDGKETDTKEMQQTRSLRK